MSYFSGSFRTAVLIVFMLAPLVLTLIPWRPIVAQTSEATSLACLTPPPNLVSWWAGESNALDSGAGANHGTLQGNVTFQSGKVGQAFFFNGDHGYVRNGNPPNLQLRTAITTEAWIKPFDVPEGQEYAVISKWGQGGALDSYLMFLRKHNGQITLAAAIGDGLTPDEGFMGGVVPANDWSHVAMTYDSSSGANILYVNGQQTGFRLLTGDIFSSDREVLVGREDSIKARQFTGLIDEPSIYSRALTGGEIAGLANGASDKCKLGTTPPAQSLSNPIVFIPGAFGSELGYKQNGSFVRLWPGVDQLLVDSVQDLRKLPDGSDYKIPKQSGPIVKKVLTKDVYQNFLERLTSQGYQVYTFPYDWRANITASAQKLKEKVDQIKQETGVDKVDLVAHSLGGLVAMEYLRATTLQGVPPSVGHFVSIGAPYLGTPEAFRALRYGRGLTGLGRLLLNTYDSKRIAHNSPAAYHMLPSADYFESMPWEHGQARYILDPLDRDHDHNINPLTFNETQGFLKNAPENFNLLKPEDYATNSDGSIRLTLNNQLIDASADLHSALDNFARELPPEIRVHTIAGWGLPTTRVLEDRIYYDSRSLFTPAKPTVRTIRDLSGDGTVPWWSATWPTGKRHYIRLDKPEIEHFNMLNDNCVYTTLINVIEDRFNVSIPGCELKTDPPVRQMVNQIFWQAQVFSPVTMHLTDAAGKHTGTAVSDVEQQVPGSTFESRDDSGVESLSFPLSDGMQLRLQGLSRGKFDLKIYETQNDLTVRTLVYRQVEVTEHSQATLVPGNNNPIMQLDYDGDGTIDQQVPPTNVYTGEDPVEIPLDILPGSETNQLNLKSNGVTTVAILTTPEFDAASVDSTTVRLGPASASSTTKQSGYEDVNKDGELDLVLHFRTPEIGLAPGDSMLCLTGETTTQIIVRGCNALKVISK